MFTNARKPTKWHIDIVEESYVLRNVKKKMLSKWKFMKCDLWLYFSFPFFFLFFRWKSKQTKIRSNSTHMFLPVLYFLINWYFHLYVTSCIVLYTEILMISLSSCQRVFFTFIVSLLHFRYFVVISLLENWKWKWNGKLKREKTNLLFFSFSLGCYMSRWKWHASNFVYQCVEFSHSHGVFIFMWNKLFPLLERLLFSFLWEMNVSMHRNYEKCAFSNLTWW